MKQITVKTNKVKEVIDITSKVEDLLKKNPAKDGMIHLYLKHTTAALTTALIEEEVDLSMLGAFEIMLPHRSFPQLHDFEHTHHREHMPAHVVASMLGPHLAIPVEDNQLQLGTFQSVVLVELNGPKERDIIVDYPQKGKEK